MKKIISTFAVLVVATSLSACGDQIKTVSVDYTVTEAPFVVNKAECYVRARISSNPVAIPRLFIFVDDMVLKSAQEQFKTCAHSRVGDTIVIEWQLPSSAK